MTLALECIFNFRYAWGANSREMVIMFENWKRYSTPLGAATSLKFEQCNFLPASCRVLSFFRHQKVSHKNMNHSFYKAVVFAVFFKDLKRLTFSKVFFVFKIQCDQNTVFWNLTKFIKIVFSLVCSDKFWKITCDGLASRLWSRYSTTKYNAKFGVLPLVQIDHVTRYCLSSAGAY